MEKKKKFKRRIVNSMVLCLGAACLLLGIQVFAQRESVIPQKKGYQFNVTPLAGENSGELLSNPDRGLRMEVYYNVKTGKSMFEYKDKDGIEELYDQIEIYGADKPQLVQVYFYLPDYRDSYLDEEAFDNMDRYFQELKKNNLKAVFRFAYSYSDDASSQLKEESTAEWMIKHLEQLSEHEFFEKYRDQIHVYQVGMVGAWGEWDSSARSRLKAANGGAEDTEKKLLQAVFDNVPEDMFLQVRYMNIKNNNVDAADTVNWNRLGYHDDFLIGNLHGWNTAGSNVNSNNWKQMTKESAYQLIDGEMIWGSANDYYKPQIGGTYIDGLLIAWRMQEHHFTSLSMTHNYKENNKGGSAFWSMAAWQREYITASVLDKNDLRYEENWFLDKDGSKIGRTLFDYIRDYLGYYLKIEDASASVSDGLVDVSITVNNYGFSAPHALSNFEIVLLDSQGEVVDRQTACAMDELQPETPVTIDVLLNKPETDHGYMLALHMTADDGTPVRFANDLQYLNGYNIIGVLD